MKLKRKHKTIIKLLITIIAEKSACVTDSACGFNVVDCDDCDLVGVYVSHSFDGYDYGLELIHDGNDVIIDIDFIDELDKKDYRLLIGWLLRNIDDNEHLKYIFNKELM